MKNRISNDELKTFSGFLAKATVISICVLVAVLVCNLFYSPIILKILLFLALILASALIVITVLVFLIRLYNKSKRNNEYVEKKM